ncbi:MAG TPA: hypothetical protein VGD80_01805, partial [Kofleriaceae bacterium]
IVAAVDTAAADSATDSATDSTGDSSDGSASLVGSDETHPDPASSPVINTNLRCSITSPFGETDGRALHFVSR